MLMYRKGDSAQKNNFVAPVHPLMGNNTHTAINVIVNGRSRSCLQLSMGSGKLGCHCLLYKLSILTAISTFFIQG